MKLLNHEELELMIVKVLEIEKGLPKGYELVHSYDPTSVAKLTLYSMAHRIRELEAELERYRSGKEGLDLQGWVDENINPTNDHA